MNKKIILVFLAFAVMISCVQLWAGETATKAAGQPAGYVVIEETVWYDLADEPAYHAQKAHDYFLKKEYAACSQEIRRLNNFLIAGISLTSGDIKKSLEKSAKELDKLSVKVAAGEVKSVKEVDNTLAKVSYNLAKHFKKAAMDAYAKKENKKAGKALKASLLYFENAGIYMEHKFEAGTADLIKDAKKLADKLIAGGKSVGEDAAKLMDKTGKMVDDFGKKLEPKKN